MKTHLQLGDIMFTRLQMLGHNALHWFNADYITYRRLLVFNRARTWNKLTWMLKSDGLLVAYLITNIAYLITNMLLTCYGCVGDLHIVKL